MVDGLSSKFVVRLVTKLQCRSRLSSFKVHAARGNKAMGQTIPRSISPFLVMKPSPI
jgi:hypothetical protein